MDIVLIKQHKFGLKPSTPGTRVKVDSVTARRLIASGIAKEYKESTIKKVAKAIKSKAKAVVEKKQETATDEPEYKPVPGTVEFERRRTSKKSKK